MSEATRKKLNDLARHEFIHKMLSEIAFDLTVCQLENWDLLEFPNMLKKEIDEIILKLK